MRRALSGTPRTASRIRGSYTQSTRAHTHRELIREWLGSLRGARVNPSGAREREKDRAISR